MMIMYNNQHTAMLYLLQVLVGEHREIELVRVTVYVVIDGSTVVLNKVNAYR